MKMIKKKVKGRNFGLPWTKVFEFFLSEDSSGKAKDACLTDVREEKLLLLQRELRNDVVYPGALIIGLEWMICLASTV